mgnify:CR=1 FL=1
MGKNKLTKFSELSELENTYQNYDVKNPELINFEGDVVEMKGRWNELHFKNDQPIVVELACGGGEYTVAMARSIPNRNYIGVDIKGARIWKGAKIAKSENLTNAAFLRTRIEQLNLFFGEQEISEIWITFPDPFLKHSKSNRRLTSPFFLNIYKPLLKKGGFINLKTDSPTLYNYTLEIIQQEKLNLIYEKDNIYTDELYTEELHFKTYYEKMHLKNSRTIKFIRYTL